MLVGNGGGVLDLLDGYDLAADDTDGYDDGSDFPG